MRQYFELLKRNSDLRFIWFAEIVSLIGDWFSQVVLLALVVSRSPGREGFAISTLLLARFLPPLLLSPYGGVLLDRFNRQKLLIWSNFLRAALGVLLLFVINEPSLLWLIYVAVILQAILGTIYMPGQSALVATVVSRDDLVTANTLSSATWSAALAAGGALGGLVAAAFGSTTALFIDAATFFVAGFFMTRVRGYRYQPAGSETLQEIETVGAQPTTAGLESAAALGAELAADARTPDDATLHDGLRYVRAHRPTFFTLFIKFGGSLGNVDTIMTIVATQIFIMGAGGELSLGIVYSAFGIGAIFGPMLTNAFSDGSPKTLRRWILLGFIGQALGWIILGWASTLILVCVGLLLRGMAGSVNWTYSSVLLQRTTPDRYRGRVFALDMTLFNFATVFATLLQGALIDTLNQYEPAQRVMLIAFGTAAISVVPLALWIYAQRTWPDDSSGLERAQQAADA